MEEQEKKDLEELRDLKLEVLHKELDLIQGCINRMANNSFLIKGWCITLVLGLITFTSTLPNQNLFLTGCIAIIVCWLSDSYFLRIERLYRKKYKWVISEESKKEKRLYKYDLNPYNKKMHLKSCDLKISIIEVFFSITLLVFYLISLILLTLNFQSQAILAKLLNVSVILSIFSILI